VDTPSKKKRGCFKGVRVDVKGGGGGFQLEEIQKGKRARLGCFELNWMTRSQVHVKITLKEKISHGEGGKKVNGSQKKRREIKEKKGAIEVP